MVKHEKSLKFRETLLLHFDDHFALRYGFCEAPYTRESILGFFVCSHIFSLTQRLHSVVARYEDFRLRASLRFRFYKAQIAAPTGPPWLQRPQ